jgi:hypothetical protein
LPEAILALVLVRVGFALVPKRADDGHYAVTRAIVEFANPK